MKKFTGNYTTDAGKALKGADRLFCRIDEAGMVYLCTGYFVYRMNALEYSAAAQPVTKCDAGNWNIERGEKRDAGPADFDVIKVFRDTVNACKGEALDRCPADFDAGKGVTLASYYSAAGFAAFYNRLYVSGLARDLTIRANGATAPAVFYAGEEAVAMVLPVKAKAEAARAVKAYFTEQPGEDAPTVDKARFDEMRHAAFELETERNALRRELDDVRGEAKFAETERAAMRETITEQADEISALRAEIGSLRAELDKLHAEQAAATVEQAADEKPAEDVKSAAEIIAARFAGLDGVRAVIKGAHTAAPVVWLAGDTEKHADAIRAAGSAKRLGLPLRDEVVRQPAGERIAPQNAQSALTVCPPGRLLFLPDNNLKRQFLTWCRQRDVRCPALQIDLDRRNLHAVFFCDHPPRRFFRRQRRVAVQIIRQLGLYILHDLVNLFFLSHVCTPYSQIVFPAAFPATRKCFFPRVMVLTENRLFRDISTRPPPLSAAPFWSAAGPPKNTG